MTVADKRAALELHRLSAGDREWVLGRLPPAERTRVLPLLAELDGMDIRFDMDSVAIAADGDPKAPEAADAAPPSEAQSVEAVIRDASVAEVLRVLADEPAWVVRAVIELDAWPWSASVRRALVEKGASRREPSVGCVELPLPPALAAALPPLLAERLRHPAHNGRVNGHANGHEGALNGFSAWGRVWPRVRKWLP